MNLQDRVVLITGAGRGVGKATALTMAKLGAKVCVTARTTTEIEDVVKEIRSAGGDAIAVTADVGREPDVGRLFDSVIEAFGRVDIVVNNAGSFPVGPISEFPDEEFDAAVRIDLKAAFMCARSGLTIGGMLERGSGHIVNIGSVSVRRQVPNMAIHCALKAALLGLSESLRREVAGRGVKVSLLCPATIDTELVQSEKARDYVHGEDKWLRPQDVADLSAYVTTTPENVLISEVSIVGL